MKNLELLIPKERPQEDRFTWATITSSSPLLIRLDGEDTPLDVTPDSLVAESWLEVGRRAWCQVHGRRVLVLGVYDGEPLPPPPPAPDPTPHIHLVKVGAQTLTSTWNQVAFDSELIRRGGFAPAVGGLVTVPKSGMYAMAARILCAATSSVVQAGIALSGIPESAAEYAYNTKGTGTLGVSVGIASYGYMSAGTQIKVLGTTNVSLALNVSANTFNSFSVTYVGP